MPDAFTSRFGDGWKCSYPVRETELQRKQRAQVVAAAKDWMRPGAIGPRVGLNQMRTTRICTEAVRLGLMEERQHEGRRVFRRKA